jgi:hypothetical protein
MMTAEEIVRGFLIADIAIVSLVMIVLIWRYRRAIARLGWPNAKRPGFRLFHDMKALDPEDQIEFREIRAKLRFTYIIGFICLGTSLVLLADL